MAGGYVLSPRLLVPVPEFPSTVSSSGESVGSGFLFLSWQTRDGRPRHTGRGVVMLCRRGG